jgi:hypothetical protein
MAILATFIGVQIRSKRMKKVTQLAGIARMQRKMTSDEMKDNLRKLNEKAVEKYRKDN